MNSCTKIFILNVIIIIHLSNRNNDYSALAKNTKELEMGSCMRWMRDNKIDTSNDTSNCTSNCTSNGTSNGTSNDRSHWSPIICMEGDANFCCRNEKLDYVWEECCTLDQFAVHHSGTLRFILIVSCVSGVIFFGIIIANINVIMMTCDTNQDDENDIKSDNSGVSESEFAAKNVQNTSETRI